MPVPFHYSVKVKVNAVIEANIKRAVLKKGGPVLPNVQDVLISWSNDQGRD